MVCCYFYMEDESFSRYKIIGKMFCEVDQFNIGVLFGIYKRLEYKEKQIFVEN